MKFLSELTGKTSKTQNNPPLHFASYYFLDQESTKKRPYHGYSSSPEAEKEYQNIVDKRKKRCLIDITSEPLKNEYMKKINYLNNGFNLSFILSFLFLIDSYMNLKYLGPSESNVAILILSSLSMAIIFLILVNIKAKILMDPHGYVLFYLFSLILTLVLMTLYMIKIINFILVFRSLNGTQNCRHKYKCPGYSIYLLLLIFSVIIFVGILACIKFILLLFYDAINVLTMRKKTIIQRQIELNERKEKSGKIEFVEDESINNSMNKLNTSDYLKTE